MERALFLSQECVVGLQLGHHSQVFLPPALPEDVMSSLIRCFASRAGTLTFPPLSEVVCTYPPPRSALHETIARASSAERMVIEPSTP